MRILRGLRSELLPCGCLAGVYETYNGEIVTLLDDRSPECGEPSHAADRGEVRIALPSTSSRRSPHQSSHGRAAESK